MDTMSKNDANDNYQDLLTVTQWQTARLENEENEILIVFPVRDVSL